MFSFSLFAFDPLQYTQTLSDAYEADDASRSTLLGIIESCGNASNIDDSCVVDSLNRVAQEENNTTAKSIAASYNQAINAGNFSNPECQTEDHMQANRILGHCILLMNYYALQNQDKEAAINKYELCLQGGMQGLVYQGNIVAQYILSELYSYKGLSEPAQTWKKGLKLRKNTPEYALLMKCYN